MSNKIQLVSSEERLAIPPQLLKTKQVSLGKLIRMYRERSQTRFSRFLLAEIVGVSDKTVRNWEGDISLPTAHHLRRLIEVFFQRNVFTVGAEYDEAIEIWLKRQDQDDRNTYPSFDVAWFAKLSEHKASGDIKPTKKETDLSSTATENVLSNKRPGNLPKLTGLTIGREKEIAQLTSLLENPEMRLVTLLGIGGVGKTRLVLQTGYAVENKFEDGVFFVCVAAISEPRLVLELIAKAFGVKGADNQTLLESLQAYLRYKNILLIVDNFEQVREAAKELVQLLENTSNLKIVITSRMTLQVYSERIFEVAPLALPLDNSTEKADFVILSKVAAIEFLVERAKRVKPEFVLTPENSGAVQQICRHLNGIPLALELAAARLKFFTPHALLQRLKGAHHSTSLQLLNKASNDGPKRQQSLRQTLEWSYNLLEIPEQTLFCYLAIFNDSSSLVACETICVGLEESGFKLERAQILNILTQLVEKSLLRYESDPDGEPRFMMLEIVREYALGLLQERKEAALLWQKHTQYFLNFAETAEAQLLGSEQTLWLARLEKEHNNLRAVLRRTLDEGQLELALGMISSLCEFWARCGYVSEGLRWTNEGLAKSENQPALALLRANVIKGAAMLAICP